VEKISLESILTETDSPYLGSEDRNRPVKVLKAVEKIADIKGLGVSEVAEVTSQNSENFF
jgi:TatD DNase family protein